MAGLQAIATARRLGAVISAYDLRPAAKEQVQSLGGRFVELPIEAKDAQDARGYARAQDEDFYRRQRELLGKVVQESDVVITAAVIPGKKSPILVTEEMVKGMAPGSVILDLAAERGGNCELTESGKDGGQARCDDYRGHQPGEPVCRITPARCMPRTSPRFLTHLIKDQKLNLNLQDEIVRETLVTRGGEIVQPRVREFFALPALVDAELTATI